MPKFGMKVPHLRCDSHISFKVKRSKIRVTDGRGGGTLCRPNPAATLLVICSLHHSDSAKILNVNSQKKQFSSRTKTSQCSASLGDFYRAMLCISAVYAGMRCLSVCVCLSVTFVSCAKMNKDIFEFFSPSGSQAILVFPHQTGWRYSDGNPPNGGVECKGGMKDDFRPISRSISETVIVRWAHAARQFVSIKFSFHPYNI